MSLLFWQMEHWNSVARQKEHNCHSRVMTGLFLLLGQLLALAQMIQLGNMALQPLNVNQSPMKLMVYNN